MARKTKRRGKAMARSTRDTRSPSSSRVPTTPRTLAGIPVTPDTAVTLSAVWACLRYLSQTVGVLPWHVMRRGARGGEIAQAHPNEYLLHERASDEWSSMQFRETLTHWALRYGNGYAEIEPDQRGQPYAMWPVHPDRVEIYRASDPGVDAYGSPIPAGGLYYEIDNGTGPNIELAPARMFHLRGFGDGPAGVNVISYAKESLGSALAAQLYGSAFFGNGASISGVVTAKKPIKDPDAIDLIRREFDGLYRGVRNANKTAVLDNDMAWQAVGIDPEKAQLILTRQHDVEEVCRWFGVPPHKAMHLLRATFSNIEHQAIEVVVDSVSPWVKRFEDEANFKLFGRQNRQGFYTKMNMNALLRGDMQSRMAFYKGMKEVGAYSPNRILELEDEQTLGPEGDIHVMQEQYKTLEQIKNPPEPETAAPAAPREPVGAAADDLTEDEDAVAARLRFEAVMAEVVDA